MMNKDPQLEALKRKRQGLTVVLNLGEMEMEGKEMEGGDMEEGQEQKRSDLAPPTEESKMKTKEELMQEAAQEQPETAEDMGWYGKVSKAFGMKRK